MANLRYSMRGRRSAFDVRRSGRAQDIGSRETPVHRVEVSGQQLAFGALTLFRLQA